MVKKAEIGFFLRNKIFENGKVESLRQKHGLFFVDVLKKRKIFIRSLKVMVFEPKPLLPGPCIF